MHLENGIFTCLLPPSLIMVSSSPALGQRITNCSRSTLRCRNSCRQYNFLLAWVRYLIDFGLSGTRTRHSSHFYHESSVLMFCGSARSVVIEIGKLLSPLLGRNVKCSYCKGHVIKAYQIRFLTPYFRYFYEVVLPFLQRSSSYFI
jgi:hypothetical protein